MRLLSSSRARHFCHPCPPPHSWMPKKVKLAGARSVVVSCDAKPAASSITIGPSAVGAKRKNDQDDEKGSGAFRFWTDARRFKGSEDKCIMQQGLFESGGVRTGGYPKAAPVPGPLGCQRPGDWDLLWSPARLALKALPVKPGQLVSACPGMMSITRKRKLSLTLKEAFGEGAFEIMPRTFSLPEELEAWRQHIASSGPSSDDEGEQRPLAEEGGSDAGPGTSSGADGSSLGTDASQQRQQLWILKTAQHLGKGLKLLPAEQAAVEAARRKGKSKADKPYVQAQQYVANPLLIQGRKFGIRVWVLVTGHNPLRAYLHTNGLLLFSTHRYNTDVWSTDKGDVALGHVTNYAQNMDGMVWNLAQLQEHLGDEAYKRLWDRISRNTALVCSAALPHIQAQHQATGALPGSTFELLGLDFLVDTDLHPWLLEVNGTPSLAVEHENPAIKQLIHEQKMGMVLDMLSILSVRDRFAPRYAAMRLAVSMQAGKSAASSSDAEETEPGPDDQVAEDAARPGPSAEGSATGEEDEASTGGASVASVSANNAAGEEGKANAGVHTKPDSRTVLMRKRLRDQMSPKSDTMVWARVRQELQRLGGFQPLMPLFPVGRRAAKVVPSKAVSEAAGSTIPWDARDVEMSLLMHKARRMKAGAASLAGLAKPE